MFSHRLPTAADDARLPLIKDIFGRERHASDRDDMSGVGNFNRPCKTLWIGNCQLGSYRAKSDDITNPWNESDKAFKSKGGHGESEGDWLNKCQEVLARHFGEWGLIERIDVKPKFDCAFISFKHRASAEFAKVAMSEQSLDNGEQLSVRWAHEDPNPNHTEQHEWENQLKEALGKRGYDFNTYAAQQAAAAAAAVAISEEKESLGVTAYPSDSFSEYDAGVTASQLAAAASGDTTTGFVDADTARAYAAAAAESDPDAAAAWQRYAEYAASAAASGTSADYGAAVDPSLSYMNKSSVYPTPPPGLGSSAGPITAEEQAGIEEERQRQEAVANMHALLDSIDATKESDHAT